MITVQLVSKPVAPPWNDGTKVLVHGILSNRVSCRYRFFGTQQSHALEGPYVRCDIVSETDRFQPTLADHARTVLRLLTSGSRTAVYHCLFTPNPRSSSALKLVLGAMRRPVVHTLCSSPDDWSGTIPLLFADRVVTVSDWAKRRLEEHGLRNVVHIPPGIAMPQPSATAIAALRQAHDLPAHRRCLVFSGDYEYSAAHPVILAALPQLIRHRPDVIIVFACRTKTPEALTIEASVRQQVDSAGLLAHVRFLRQVDDFDSLLALATLFLFPVQSLHRKMDIPLVLLQALALGKPIVISTLGPLTELLTAPIGLGVPAGDAAALTDALVTLLGDDDRCAAIQTSGPSLVAERYSAAQMARAYEHLYASLCEAARAA